MSYLYEHGPLCLHDHLQQRFDQSLRCSWDQVEKVNDGRTYLHLLEKENRRERSRGKKGVNENLEKMQQDRGIMSDRKVLMDGHCGKTRMNLGQTTENAICGH